MTDTSHLSNRANRREALRTAKQRRKPDASTLRQRRIEREQAARDRTAEWIEKRGSNEAEDRQRWFGTLIDFIERHGCVWYLPVFGALVGVAIGMLLRMAGEAIDAVEMLLRILWRVLWGVEVPENTIHECLG